MDSSSGNVVTSQVTTTRTSASPTHGAPKSGDTASASTPAAGTTDNSGNGGVSHGVRAGLVLVIGVVTAAFVY